MSIVGTDGRHQAKVLLAWGFLLVGAALLMHSFLAARPPVATATETPVDENPVSIVTEQDETAAPPGRKRSRRKA